MRVDAGQATAHVDVAGTLRDIFASIFADLGDLQLEELRQAIKQSFDDLGWASRPADSALWPLPPFRAFFEILRTKTKPNAGLVVFDEAHRAARLKLIPQFAKECRRFGLSLILASQQARDSSRRSFRQLVITWFFALPSRTLEHLPA